MLDKESELRLFQGLLAEKALVVQSWCLRKRVALLILADLADVLNLSVTPFGESADLVASAY